MIPTKSTIKTIPNEAAANQESLFCSYSIEDLLNRLNKKLYVGRIERNNLILNVIRIKQPISKYELAKISGLSYPTIKQITKELAFVGLIFLRNAMGDNGLPVKLICLEAAKNE